MELYKILEIGFYACLAAAILLFVLGIVLFFLLDIRSVHKSRTGREKAKAISEMQKDADTTGRMIQKKKSGRSSGKLDDNKLVITKGTVLSPEEAAAAPSAAVQEEGGEKTSMLGGDSSQTVMLGAEKAETSVLEAPTQKLGEAETSVLVQAQQVPQAQGVRFDVVKKIVCCDTQETIA